MEFSATEITAILDAFGGPKSLAEAIGSSVTTPYQWGYSGKIPKWRLEQISRAARRKRVKLPVWFAARLKSEAIEL